MLLLPFIVSSASAQDIIFNVKTYKGGYNVSCNGSTDGNIDATIVGGVPPYTYSWSNGATAQDLINIGAGAYTLTVTDAVNNSKSKSVTLFEADIIDVFLFPTLYEGGYHISKMGASDGAIATDVKGGAPPYSYLWNNGSKKANLSGLTAGAYSVTITDQNGCVVTKSITLLEPTPITISITATTYGSYNTSCFKSSDGNINVTVSGGMPPYKYNWSNGSFDEDLTNVPADEYKLLVYDANKATAEAQITLTQPDPLKVTLTSPLYPNDYNISCTGCFNGSITSQVQGGTMPATYLWKGKNVNGQTTANLSNLGPGDYVLTVTDANGCETVDKIFLFEPPANSWDKSGNVIDNTNFLGSTNNVPLVLKTTDTERLRIDENGNVGIGTSSPQSKLDVNGNATVTGNLNTTAVISDNITATNISTSNFTISNALTSNEILTRRIKPATGDSIIIIGDSSIVYASNNRLYPDFSAWTGTGGIRGIGIGHPQTLGIGEYSVALGRASRSVGKQSLSFGDYVRANADNSIVIGSGIPVSATVLINSVPNSLSVGFNSNLPTLFVTPASGIGTTGKVGIGTSSPSQKLEVAHSDATGGIVINQVDPANANKKSEIKFSLLGVQQWAIGSHLDPNPAGPNSFFIWNNIANYSSFYIDATTNNIGFGTIAPSEKLDITHDDEEGGIVLNRVNGSADSKSEIKFSKNGVEKFAIGNDFDNNGKQTFFIWNHAANSAPLLINEQGKVGLGGTIPPVNGSIYKLYVDGGIATRDVKVTNSASWPDYVFEASYPLISIYELEKFIKKNHHLPGISSAKEIEKNEGFELGEMQIKLVKQVEEQTLYIIQLQKQMDEMKKELSELKNK